MSYSRRQLYALGEPLGDSVTRRKADGGLVLGDGGGGGGGGSSNSTQTTTQTTELPEWARPYAQRVLAKGETLTEPTVAPTYKDQRYAGLSNLQQQAIGSISTPEAYQKSLQTFMDPYAQNVIDIQKREAGRQSAIAGLQEAGQAVKSGAFGGARSGLVEAERQRNLGQLMSDIQQRGSEAAYQNAQQAMQRDIANKMQLGAIQQQDIQRPLDIAYQDFLAQKNYPYQQLSYMSNLIRGTPMGMSSQSQVYQAPPSPLQTMGALGLGGYGLSKLGMFADGGSVDGYADGGSVADKFNDPEAMLADMSKLTDQQLQQILQAPTTPAEAEAAQREMAIRASERRGLAGAFNQMPQNSQQSMVRAAGGGILAFERGGVTPSTESEDGPQYEDGSQNVQQVVSPGNPGVYQSALQQALDYGRQIGNFQPKGMTTEDYNKAIADRYALMQKLGGESPYAKFEQQLAERDTERGRAREEGKGIAALQAIPAILQPGGTIRGLGAAAGSLGGSYAKLAEADAAEKRSIQNLQFNLADAQRKERMGLGREAIAAADQARKDQADINRAHIQKLQAQATIASRVAQAAKPTGQGGAGKGPKINEQLAAAEVDYENDPSDANLKRVTALRRAVAQTKTTDIGKTKADLTREGQVSQENAKVQAAMNKFKYDPAYLEARQAGPEEADRVWREELARQRQLFGRENPEMAPVNKNSPEAKTTRIKLDAKGNVIP